MPQRPLPLTLAVIPLLVLAAAPAQTAERPANAPPDGFVALFDGASLDGWWGLGTEDPRAIGALSATARAARVEKSLADVRRHWRVEDGELVNDGQGLYLTTLRDYGDFELLVDYRTVAGADSGIYLRGIPQVQIWDTTEAGGKWGIGADKGSGGLWNNSAGAPGKDPLVHADRPFGEWNRFRILMVGSRVSIWLNGRMVVDGAVLENYFDRTLPVPRSGPIQLQTHGGEIRWRNVFLREIGSDEANDWLAARLDEEFAPAFGADGLAGWRGPIDNYALDADGVLTCKPGKGGTIHTAQEFRDFEAAMQIRFPPGGNNGLAIRYPGNGDTAYVGMCELQVLDNSHPKYAGLDPRQFHGSAYGMVAAHRGYQRPVGDWNFQRVTVRGTTIRVELNGFVILDADLAKVAEFMGGNPHPGKDNEAGSFGFAGHSDPVQFRHVMLRELRTD